MPRSLRIEYPGAWYHVMNRGLGRRSIFASNKDRETFLKLLGDISETFRIEVHAYSLMNNHYHLLIQTPEGKLSRAMRHLNGVYTQIYNKRNQTDGPLFRGRYKSLLVDSDEYLLELVRYIHLNPVEAKLCAHPQEHVWTSHLAYLNAAKRPEWLKTEEVLSRFSLEEKKALYELDQFICAGVSSRFKKTLNEQPFIIGDKDFQDWIYRNFGDPKIKIKETAFKNKTTQAVPKIKKIIEHVAFAFNTTVPEIRQCQSGKKNEARAMAIYLARKMTGIKQSELARWMNARNEQAITKSRQRFVARLEREKQLRSMTAQVKTQILSAVMT